MVLWIEINRWKIPLPFTGWMIRLALQKAGKLDEKSAKQIWKALKTASRQFPNLTLVEAEEAGGERVKISFCSLRLWPVSTKILEKRSRRFLAGD